MDPDPVHPPFFNLGLCGWPLEHSLSPRLHHAALHALNLAGEYKLYSVPPIPEGATGLHALLEQVRQGDLQGLNVTIPHKQSVLPLMDELSPTARCIGAVNTISLVNGKLCGDNTDAPGFMADLEHLLPAAQQANGARALVLGAGGSARAVVYALVKAGWQVNVTARRIEQARQLVESLVDIPSSVAALPFQVSMLEQPYTLLVNTTPVGMFPGIGESPWPASAVFPTKAALYDLVYNPAETQLVRNARASGLQAANGLGMLIEQAALAFETWSGQTAPRDAMREAVQEFLTHRTT
jgi:shikimate dehydrogenase